MNIYLNTDGAQFFFCYADNTRVDSFSGPREFMIRTYIAQGYIVHDERGRRATIG